MRRLLLSLREIEPFFKCWLRGKLRAGSAVHRMAALSEAQGGGSSRGRPSMPLQHNLVQSPSSDNEQATVNTASTLEEKMSFVLAHHGQLWKKGGGSVRANWKKRFFIFDPANTTRLFYKKAQSHSKAAGVITLTKYSSVVVLYKDNKTGGGAGGGGGEDGSAMSEDRRGSGPRWSSGATCTQEEEPQKDDNALGGSSPSANPTLVTKKSRGWMSRLSQKKRSDSTATRNTKVPPYRFEIHAVVRL